MGVPIRAYARHRGVSHVASCGRPRRAASRWSRTALSIADEARPIMSLAPAASGWRANRSASAAAKVRNMGRYSAARRAPTQPADEVVRRRAQSWTMRHSYGRRKNLLKRFAEGRIQLTPFAVKGRLYSTRSDLRNQRRVVRTDELDRCKRGHTNVRTREDVIDR